MEIESLPTPIDTVQRGIISLEIEKQALSKEDDPHSKRRLSDVEREIAELTEQVSAMKAQWQREKELIDRIRKIKEAIDKAKTESELAQRRGDLNRAAELRYGEIPKLEKELAGANQALESAKQGGKSFLREEVTEEDVAAIVAKWTGIPVEKMLEGEMDRLNKMEDRLHLRVVGQEQAIAAIANAVRRSRAGLSDPKRPIGSFIFLGPTGVGKTELARALAQFLFDDESHMVRLDMGEYMEKHAVSRLIGAPPGYVGYEEGGQLTEAVRRRPYSVVLFDEIEKAHPDVFNTLLQVLDDGRLTDGQGRTVDFKNTVIIMTSNVGSQYLQDVDDVDDPNVRREIDKTLRAAFKPEFLNRVDDIIVFHRLGRKELEVIVGIQLERVTKLLAERQLRLELSKEAMELLCDRGYDPTYGARPLKRAIQRYLQDPLAKAIISGQFKPGDRIRGERRGDEIAFQVTAHAGESDAA
jgi:ATP-dependent Clp protease ATP-binding subunit ClpB